MAKISVQSLRNLKRSMGQGRGGKSPPGGGGSSQVPSSDSDLRLGITEAEIEPNTYGEFRFTQGAKGSEIPYGDPIKGYYRPAKAEDPPPLPEGTLCYVMWVACDDLNETEEETGWELTPVLCIEDEEE